MKRPNIQSLRRMFSDLAQTRTISGEAKTRFDDAGSFQSCCCGTCGILSICDFLANKVEIERPPLQRLSRRLSSFHKSIGTLPIQESFNMDMGVVKRIETDFSELQRRTKICSLTTIFGCTRAADRLFEWNCPLLDQRTEYLEEADCISTSKRKAYVASSSLIARRLCRLQSLPQLSDSCLPACNCTSGNQRKLPCTKCKEEQDWIRVGQLRFNFSSSKDLGIFLEVRKMACLFQVTTRL